MGDSGRGRKEQILAAAATCFSRKGYYRTTMADIVTESGLGKGTLYWYFDSKKALFVSLFQATMEQFRQKWEAISADQSLGAREKLVASLALFRADLAGFVPISGLAMEAWELIRSDEDTGLATRELYEPYLEIMDRILQQGVAEGEFHVEAPRSTALVLLTLLDGITLALGTELWEGDWDLILDAATTFVLRGVGARTGSDD